MFRRYAIYYTADGALADAGAAWLGWEVATGRAVAQPEVPGLDVETLTERPRKYGFHATLKPPFALKEGMTAADLETRLDNFCASHASVVLDGLEVSRLGRFFALTPVGDVSVLEALATDIVRGFDDFRAPPSEAELARRRGSGLSPEKEANLQRWGYPHVMEAFRFHMTLTGRVQDPDSIAPLIAARFAGVAPSPFTLDHLTLVGEREADGMFEQVGRLALKRQICEPVRNRGR